MDCLNGAVKWGRQLFEFGLRDSSLPRTKAGRLDPFPGPKCLIRMRRLAMRNASSSYFGMPGNIAWCKRGCRFALIV
jgi:hypothetical protein